MCSNSSSPNLRLGFCMMCRGVEAKYRCPECETVTCSLTCVNKHKKQFDCSGIRSKTEYVPVKNMNDFHILSDYRLLEEVARVKDANSRIKIKRFTRKDAPLPHHLQKFRSAMRARNSRIYFLPPHFARHKENTTILNWKTNQINWRIKVVFLHAKKYTLPVSKCSEDTKLEVVVEKCLNAAMERNRQMRSSFEAYQHLHQDILVLMQVEKIPGAQQKMFILDTRKTLRENFEGKRIVEYPVFYIALKGFFTAEALKDAAKVEKGGHRIVNLLLSNYSLSSRGEPGGSEKESSSEDEVGRRKEDGGSEDSDEECDGGISGSVSDILNSLYKQAIDSNEII